MVNTSTNPHGRTVGSGENKIRSFLEDICGIKVPKNRKLTNDEVNIYRKLTKRGEFVKHLKQQCSQCGKLHKPEAKFCSNCGTKLPNIRYLESNGQKQSLPRGKMKYV